MIVAKPEAKSGQTYVNPSIENRWSCGRSFSLREILLEMATHRNVSLPPLRLTTTLSCAKDQLSYTYFTLIPGCHLTQANASVGQGANQRGERKYEHLEQRSPIALASRVATAIPTPAPLNRKKSMNRRTRVQLLNPNFQQHIKKW